MSSKPIGVFDSGAGGLCTVRELQRLMPNESIIYLSDTAHAPYGARSRELITSNTLLGLEFLEKQGVKLLVSACGTASTVLPESAVKRFGVPFFSTLLSCAQEACAMSAHGVIGVVGTQTAIRTSAFGRAIRNIRTDARVVGNACPLFVPLADSGNVQADNHLLRLAAKQYLEPMLREGIDTLILGSTHYSVLFSAISDVLGYGVTLVDAASVTARHVQSFLLQSDLRNEEGSASDPIWYVTDAPQEFKENSKTYYGREIQQNVLQIAL